MSNIIVLGAEGDQRDLIALVLELGGHHCETANSLSEAVTLLHKMPFDLFLADSQLYGSLSDFLAGLLHTAWPKLRVAMLARKDERPAGEFQVLAVPCCPEQIFQFIERTLGNTVRPAFAVRKNILRWPESSSRAR